LTFDGLEYPRGIEGVMADLEITMK